MHTVEVCTPTLMHCCLCALLAATGPNILFTIIVARFSRGIVSDSNRAMVNLVITSNTLIAGWDNTAILPALLDVIRGIVLSGTTPPNWVVTNNLIRGATQGIRVEYRSTDPVPDFSAVNITLNRSVVHQLVVIWPGHQHNEALCCCGSSATRMCPT